MSTRSAIGIKHGLRIKAIYCHFDGYLGHVGLALNTYYQDSIKVNKLISMGDMSGIGADIGEEHDFDQRKDYLDDGIASVCTFYKRDRAEEGVEFKSFDDEAAFMDYYDGCGCEYYYLYDHGVWYVNAYRRGFEPLHVELAREAEEAEAE
jgi:hypothetical protein